MVHQPNSFAATFCRCQKLNHRLGKFCIIGLILSARIRIADNVSCGLDSTSFGDPCVRATVDDVLGDSGHAATELRQMVVTVFKRNETVGRLLGEQVDAHLAGK